MLESSSADARSLPAEPSETEPSDPETAGVVASVLRDPVVLSCKAGSSPLYCSEVLACAPAASAVNRTRVKADAAANTTVMIRRISPPPRTLGRVARHCTRLLPQKHLFLVDFLKFFTSALQLCGPLPQKAGSDPKRSLPGVQIGGRLRSGFDGAPYGVFWPRLGEPAGDLDLILGKEPHPVLAGGVQVPVEGVLHAVEREEGHRGGDPYVHAKHPCLYILPPVSHRSPVLGVDRAGVPKGRAVGELYGLIQRANPHHGEHRSEDLLARHAHSPIDPIEDGRSEEEAFLPWGLSAVEDDLSTLLLP